MPFVSDEFMTQLAHFAEIARQELARRCEPSFVQRTPGVCGGRARVRDTRIPVWTVIQMVRMGAAEADVLADLPTLADLDFDAVWAYYRRHATEIEKDIAENSDEQA